MNKYHDKNVQRFMDRNNNRARFLIKCHDQQGIVAAVSQYLFEHHANIVASNQYTLDPEGGEFFMRVEFECEDLENKRNELEEGFQPIAEKFGMDWTLLFVQELKNMAIFVSKEVHCLLELLWEWQSGDLLANISVVISNHDTARELVESYGIPFYHIPASKENRREAEAEQIELLDKYDVDLVVLARYMQILTPDFVKHYENRLINIHHSFLPAFVGANPYARAYQRGVKMIGATSHYVTNELDEGPIIEQDIERVTHEHNEADLKKIGQSIERRVLARAVKWHLEDRIIVHENKTIVF